MHSNLWEKALFEIEEDYQEPDGITAKVPIYGGSFSPVGVRDLEALEAARACLLLLASLPP